MAINTQKVVIGGVAAGVVVTLVDFVSYSFLLGDRMTAEANAFKAGLGDQMSQMEGSMMAVYLLMNLVIGIVLVTAYAIARPRLGPGPMTAAKVAFLFWLFGVTIAYGYMQIGMMSAGLWLTYGLIWLVCLLVAAMVGARIYTEADGT